MYVAPHHAMPTPADAQALIDAHPLGAWVVRGEDDALQANHIPFLLDRTRGPHGTLLAHVARANPVWRALPAAGRSVVMFQGAQSYITPGWYPGKQAHGRVVPTWNYAVAHVHGTARTVHDDAWLRDMPWAVSDAPPDYITRMLRAVVGIEIPIDRLDAKCKASQDEDLPDRRGTVAGLRADGSPGADAMAALVERALAADGHH